MDNLTDCFLLALFAAIGFLSKYLFLYLIISITLLFIFLIFAMAKAPWALGDAVEPIGTVREIGILLLTDFLLPFEIISLLLLGALIGAAVLSRGDA